jgi:hypothetical protein
MLHGTPVARRKRMIPETAALYWADARLWREANHSLSRLLRIWSGRLGRARRMAQRIEALFCFVIPVMEELCEVTCPACTDPCCLRARARFDLADLLFLHLAGQAIPLAQAGPDDRAACRYLGSTGCILPRLSRPWVCRWYLCPQQKRLVRLDPASGQRRFELALARIRRLRRDLEGTFIQAVSP